MTATHTNGSAWWSPALGRPGETVADLDDIDQALRILFATPKGSDPHRPTFGADLDSPIDLPIDIAGARIASALIEAVEAWEPRVRVLRAPVEIDGSQLRYRLIWRLAGGGAARTLAGAIDFAGAR